MSTTPKTSLQNPLVDAAPTEVPLPQAPLVAVLAQVRFSPLLSINNPDFIASFQEELRSNFPILRHEQSRDIFLKPDDVSVSPQKVIWRFVSADKQWQVSLASSFLAFETTAYESRDDFLGRFEEVLDALVEHINPHFMERIGLRYIDRIVAHESELGDLIRPEILGVLSTPLRDFTALSLQESLFELPQEEARMRARWGLLPARATPDPSAIRPIEEESWLLDIDVFAEEEVDFDPAEIIAKLRSFAERTYTVFRWAVTDQFLERYGGEL